VLDLASVDVHVNLDGQKGELENIARTVVVVFFLRV